MRIYLIVILFVFFSLAGFAESNNLEKSYLNSIANDSLNTNIAGPSADTINISQMVSAQIEAARIKQTQDSLITQESKSLPLKTVAITQAVVSQKPKRENSQLESLFTYIKPLIQRVLMFNEMTIKLTIMAVATVLAFLFVFARRKKLNTKKIKSGSVKDGIKLIREERVKDRNDSELSLIRKKLMGSTSSFQLSSDSVLKNARELNIAKGEIYLAARIKSHELKKVSF
jgi:hypothetical protein